MENQIIFLISIVNGFSLITFILFIKNKSLQDSKDLSEYKKMTHLEIELINKKISENAKIQK